MVKLYRPVGFKELELILNAENKSFPPRLKEQPFFYPVLNFDYANQIAQKWNTVDEKSGYVGYVTEFYIDCEYFSRFEVHTVGTSIHQELWVESEELAEFNNHIQNNILILEAFYGDNFYKNKRVIDKFIELKKLKELNEFNYICGVLEKWKVVIQNYFLWLKYDFSNYNISISERNDLVCSMKKILIENEKWFIKYV